MQRTGRPVGTIGRQDRPVITSPASIWTRSTIRRRMGLKGRFRTHTHIYDSQCNILARMPLVGVMHVAPVSLGLPCRMRRVEATYKPQTRSSLGSNHATDMTPPIGAAYLPRHRFPVTGGAAPMARAANT